MNTQEREQLMHELKVITLLSAEEIENFRIVHGIKLAELKKFYLNRCRLPTAKECEAIKVVGFDVMMYFTEKPPELKNRIEILKQLENFSWKRKI